jgi:hypothetical protein
MSRGEDAGAVPVQELCERTQGWVGGLLFRRWCVLRRCCCQR